MARRSTTTGNFSHTSLGRNWHARKGWRRFFFEDSRCRLQDDQGITVSSNAEAPCTVDESSGNTVITFKATHDGNTSGFTLDGFVGGITLLTDTNLSPSPMSMGAVSIKAVIADKLSLLPVSC